MTADTNDDSTPRLPRRIVLASIGSAVLAGGAVALAGLGSITAPGRQTFQFSRGTSFATGEEARLRAYLVTALQDDRVHVSITGHSGTTGDAAANEALSLERADAVRDIALSMGIAADQIAATGVGGADPLPRPADTSDRAWQSDLARVDVSLQVRR